MKVDASQSRYQEAPGASSEFDRTELRRLRYLLRRLRFLEARVRESGGLADPTANGGGGAMHTELEIEALEYVLYDCGFLAEPNE